MPTIPLTNLIPGAQVQPGVEANGAPPSGYGPFTSPGVPASGYLNGIAEVGALVIAQSTGALYSNTGTKAATVWTAR